MEYFELITQEELVAGYKKRGVQVSPAIVFTPCFEVMGHTYYVLKEGDPLSLLMALAEVKHILLEQFGDNGYIERAIDIIDEALGLKDNGDE